MLKISFAAPMLIGLACSGAFAQLPAACSQACHGPSLIAQQRLDAPGWTRELNKMIGWGAAIPDSDKEALIAYLAKTFNNSRPRPASSKALPEGKGRDVFQVSCLNCHDESAIAALKTDRAGWTRILDRMVEWGASIAPARKEDLLDYLLSFNRQPRPR
jgi:hypothetical protein